MTYRSLRIALFGTLALALNMLLAPAAHAGAYVGKWDPTYGAPFGNLGWRGEARFDIPAVPGCNANGAACVGGASATSAQVLFYDTNSNANIAVINWNVAELGGVTLTALQFQGDAVAQFATTPYPSKFPQLFPNVDGANYGFFDSNAFWLEFFIAAPPIVVEFAPNAAAGAPSGPQLWWTEVECGEFCSSGVNDFVSFPPTLVVTQVPEPGSVAMLAAALLAAGAATRRRRG